MAVTAAVVKSTIPDEGETMSIRIICINKAGGKHDDPHEAITRLYWVDEEPTGKQAFISREDLHDWLNAGGKAFVHEDGARAPVIPFVSRSWKKCVKTRPDSTKKDNLLNLDECR